MRRLILLLTLLCCGAYAYAATAQEDEQDRRYTLCLAQRKVDAANMTKDDVAVCLKEAGIEDPRDQARKISQEAWQGCIMKNSLDFDDGVSPVREVARAVVQLCSVEWRNLAASMALPPRAKRKMANGLETYAVDDSVRLVLIARRTTRDRQGRR